MAKWPVSTVGNFALLLAILCNGCDKPQAQAPRPVLRIAVGGPGLARSIADQLARRLTNVDFRLVRTAGSIETAQLMRRGEIDAGIVDGSAARAPSRDEGADPLLSSDGLRAISLVYVAPFHFVVRRGAHIRTVSDLRGRRFGAGHPLSGTRSLADLLLQAFKVDRATVLGNAVTTTEPDDVAQVAAGTLDAALVMGTYPSASVAAAIQKGAELLSLDGPAIDAMRRQFPFIRLVSIPAGTYPGQEFPIHTIGADTVLVCRNDVPTAVVFDLTRAFFDALPDVLGSLTSPLPFVDPGGASATPIPLHPGAATYFREVELTR